VVETEVLVSEDISIEVQQVEPSPTPCLVTWGRLTITKTPLFRDKSEPERSTKDESRPPHKKSAREERSTEDVYKRELSAEDVYERELSPEDVYKRKILEKRTSERSSSRGEIFCLKKSKLTIEDVTHIASSEEQRNEGYYHQVEPVVEEEEEKVEKSPQKKESVLIEELLDDICERKERGNDYNRDSASRDMRERSKTADLQKLPQQKESAIIEELSGKSYDKIKKEEKLNKETIDIVPLSKSLLFEAKLDTKQGKVDPEDQEGFGIGSGNEVVEKDQDKDDTEPTTRKSFVREKLLSGNPSKEYFVSPDISLINMIGRMGKKGAVAEKLVARQKLETENDGSRDLEEELVVRKILKEFGDEEEEEDSEHLLLGFEHQDQSRNLVRLLLLLLLLLLPILLLPHLLLPSHPTSCAHQEEAGAGAVGGEGDVQAASPGSCSLDGYVFLSSLP